MWTSLTKVDRRNRWWQCDAEIPTPLVLFESRCHVGIRAPPLCDCLPVRRANVLGDLGVRAPPREPLHKILLAKFVDISFYTCISYSVESSQFQNAGESLLWTGANIAKIPTQKTEPSRTA